MAASIGEAFDIDTGLPVSMLHEQKAIEDVESALTWLQLAKKYAEHKWSRVAGKSRKGMADVLRDVTFAVLPKLGKSSEWQP